FRQLHAELLEPDRVAVAEVGIGGGRESRVERSLPGVPREDADVRHVRPEVVLEAPRASRPRGLRRAADGTMDARARALPEIDVALGRELRVRALDDASRDG